MLNERLLKAMSPLEITGPEWPLERAKQDGRAEEDEQILKWLAKHSRKPSPDGAQNTED